MRPEYFATFVGTKVDKIWFFGKERVYKENFEGNKYKN
jgi:hypothetical protein